jgi:hypothetical protein
MSFSAETNFETRVALEHAAEHEVGKGYLD